MNASRKPARLTPKMLQRIISEEIKKFGEMEPTEDHARRTKETGADEYANTLDKHIDYMKALKVEEGRLTKRLGRVREALARAGERLVVAKVS